MYQCLYHRLLILLIQPFVLHMYPYASVMRPYAPIRIPYASERKYSTLSHVAAYREKTTCNKHNTELCSAMPNRCESKPI